MKLLLTIVCSCAIGVCFCSTIHVGPHQRIHNITDALATASINDTILVEKAVYREHNIVITKPVYLKGLDYPVLDGEGKYEIVSVRSDNVTIDGFNLQRSGVSSLIDYAAIKIYNRQKVTISNNIIFDCFFGIYSQSSSHCTIQNNRLTGIKTEEQQSGNGIHCWKCSNMRIVGNEISGHRDGIYFEFVTNSYIWRNKSKENLRYGLHFMFSNDDTYILNTFEGNGSGVAVMFSHGVRMIKNNFRQNWGDAAYGLLLKEISDSYIDYNIFEKNTTGIYAEGASRIIMQRNIFKSNGWAMKVQASCMSLQVSNNNFLANSFDVGTNGSLVLNTYNYNYWDKYEGYDINRDRFGDVPYRPVSMYSMIIERNAPAMMLFHSFITSLMDKTEKVIPSLTPENLKDEHPRMKPLLL